METIFGNCEVKRHRKNLPKFVERLVDRACHLLSQNNNLEEINKVLRLHLKDIEYNGSIYISYMPVNTWNAKERLFIRNSNGDYTLVSIQTKSENK